MTIQYSSDTKRGYEDFLKKYDEDKSGVADWTEYLTNLQLGVKDQTTAYQKSAYKDISQAYRNYFLQSASLANKGLSGGLVNQLDEQLYGSFADTRANIQNTTANKIAGLFENYSKTVTEASEQLSERASNLTKVTEAALDWYEQVGSSKKVLDENMQETNDYRYQDLIDYYNANSGELWQKSSDDITSPYVLSGLGHAVIDAAFADEDFANYLKDYDSKLDLRDIFLENKNTLYEALDVNKKDYVDAINDTIFNKKLVEATNKDVLSPEWEDLRKYIRDTYKGDVHNLDKVTVKRLMDTWQHMNSKKEYDYNQYENSAQRKVREWKERRDRTNKKE